MHTRRATLTGHSAFIPRTKIEQLNGIGGMKAAELLRISTEILRTLSENGIRLEDYRYVKAYEEYLTMRGNNVKYDTAMRILSEDYNVSERTLARIIERLSKDL